MSDKIKRVGNAVREENNARKLRKSLRLALIIGLIIIMALAGLKIAEKTSVESLSSDNSQSGAYPVSFSTNDIKDVKAVGRNIVVLTKRFATVLSKGGDILSETPVSFGDSAVTVAGEQILVFDRLSNKYLIIDEKGSVTERKADESGKIYNAKLSEKGKTLLSLKSDSSASLVSVTDKKGEDIFLWSCTQEYIIDLALSKNEKVLYCAGISASGGEIYTKVYAVNIKKGTEKSYTIPSEAVVSLNAVAGDRFNVVTTDGMYIFDSSKDEILISSVKFNSDIICCAADEKGNTAVVTHSAGNLSEDTLTVYSGEGKIKYSLSLQDGIQDICIEKDKVYLLYNDFIISAKNSKIADKLAFENKAVGICKAEGQLYCYSLGGVEKVKG